MIFLVEAESRPRYIRNSSGCADVYRAQRVSLTRMRVSLEKQLCLPTLPTKSRTFNSRAKHNGARSGHLDYCEHSRSQTSPYTGAK